MKDLMLILNLLKKFIEKSLQQKSVSIMGFFIFYSFSTVCKSFLSGGIFLVATFSIDCICRQDWHRSRKTRNECGSHVAVKGPACPQKG